MPVRFKGSARPRRIKSPDPLNMPVIRENIVPRIFAEVAYFNENGELPQVGIDLEVAAFGINTSNQLIKYPTMLDLWNSTNATVIGSSPVSWTRTNEYLIHNNEAHGVTSDGRVLVYPSMEDLWDGTNLIRTINPSPFSWTRNNQLFADPITGNVYGINNTGRLIQSADGTLDGIWTTNNAIDLGISAGGWTNVNEVWIDHTGVAWGIANNNVLFRYPNIGDLWNNISSGVAAFGVSPVGWTRENNKFVYGRISRAN